MDAINVQQLPTQFTNMLEELRINESDHDKQRAAYDSILTTLKYDEAIGKIREDVKVSRLRWSGVENQCASLIGMKQNSSIDFTKLKCYGVMQVAALRVLAVIEGPDFGNNLLAIGSSKCVNQDLRAWAYYSLETAGLKGLTDAKPDAWSKLIQEGLNDDSSGKVRQWVAYILGNLNWWKIYTNKKSETIIHADIEEELIKQWKQEIDIYVLSQILKSLGQIGGFKYESLDGNIKWPVIKVLEQALHHRNPLIRERVPGALAAIGETIMRRELVAPEAKVMALNELLSLFVETWLVTLLEEYSASQNSHLNEEAQPAVSEKIIMTLNRLTRIENSVLKLSVNYADAQSSFLETGEFPLFRAAAIILQTDGLDYDAYRAAIQEVASFIPKFFPTNNTHHDPCDISRAKKGLGLLLDIAGNKNIKISPVGLRHNVRERAVTAVRSLVDGEEVPPACKKWICDESESPALPRLKMLLADPDKNVARAVTDTIVSIMGAERATEYFVQVILKDDQCDKTIIYCCDQWEKKDVASPETVRERAALAIGGVKESNDACNLLADEFRLEEEPAYSRAKQALEIMGGLQASEALLTASRRKWIETKYFAPIDKADDHGYQILDRTIKETVNSLRLTRAIAFTVVAIGVVLTISAIANITIGNANVYGVGGVLFGAVCLISGMLGSFFWNPAKAIQKANAEMASQIMGFHGYLSRMRLLGLGFAHAYSKDEENQEFLMCIFKAAGAAVDDAGKLFGGIGAWPSTPVLVPDFVGKSMKDAPTLAKQYGLEIVYDKLDYDNQVEAEKISKQSIAPQTPIIPGSIVELTISRGKQSNGSASAVIPA